MLGTRYIPELLFTALSPSFPPPTHSFGSSNTGVLAIPQTYISTLSFHHKLLPFAVVIPRAWDILPSDICMFGCSLCQLCTWILLPQKPLVTQGPHTLVSTHKLVLVIVWGFFFSCCWCTYHLLVYYIISFSHWCFLNLPLVWMLHKGRDFSLALFGFSFSLLDPNA